MAYITIMDDLKILRNVSVDNPRDYMYLIVNPFTSKSDSIDFTLSNTRWFYLSKGDPLGVKELKNYLP